MFRTGLEQHEVIVVGAGPAGLAAALALSKNGLDCTVVDSRHPPIDKACGEGLMPDALEALAQLGVAANLHIGAAFCGIRFLDSKSTVESAFPEGYGLGIRRTKLQKLLHRHAEAAGIKLIWGHAAKKIAEGQLEISERASRKTRVLSYKWLVGADGQSSSIRQQCGLEAALKQETRFGFRQHFRGKPWTDFVEVYWSSCGQIYVTPVGPEEIGIALCTREANLRVSTALDYFPELKERLGSMVPSSRELGAVTCTRRLKQVARGSAALVGDASGSVDAVTGEGLALSFRQALALADALCSGELAYYNEAHERINRLPGKMAALLLQLDRHPLIRERAFSALAASPKSFSRLLSVHLGNESLWRIAMTEAPGLSWRWLTT